MSIVVTRSSAASTASGNLLNSSVSYSGGKYMSGGYSSRSVLTSSRRSPSVYGGAGGYGTRISTALPTFGSASSATEFSFNTNEKLTMQNLNDRLASYLEKVGSLESANRKLELQIRELYDKRTPTSKKDLSGYYATISELRKKISHGFRGHASVTLQVDNARLAADDFRMKYDAEMNLRLATEADMGRLKRVLEELTMSQSDLEIQVDGLNEDLTFVQKNHSEELESLRAQQCGSVNVEMDCARSMDLSKEMHAMREQYETMVDRNRQEAEAWFQGKVEALNSQMTTSTTEIKTSNTELTELQRSVQTMEIELQGHHSQVAYLTSNLQQVRDRYSLQMTSLQQHIHSLEAELQQLNASIQQQASEYKLLLDIKMRLEMEIAEYRRLLEGGSQRVVEVEKVVETVQVVEEPLIQRRVKTIIEEIVDGKVVSKVVEENVENVN